MNTNSQSLQQLVKIYGFRQIAARRRYDDQKKVVNNCLQELADISQSVARLHEGKSANSQYMRGANISSDAQKMVSALKYQSQIEYDLERESFYLSMAQDELQTQQARLDSILAEIEKFSAKIESVSRIERRHKNAVAARDELAREDDYLQILNSNGGYRV